MEAHDYNAYQEEISLREIIEVILKGWKLITAITLTAVLISAVVSFFIIEPTYEASATLMASAADKVETPPTGEGISGILNSMSSFPTPTLETYKEQVKSPVLLQQVLDELGIQAEELTMGELTQKISVEVIANTNLIRIKVKDSDPGLAADLANSLAENFTVYVSTQAKKQALTSYQNLEQQMNVERDKLDKALTEYKEFLAQPRGVKELQAEIDARLQLITNYKIQFMQKEVEQNAKKAALDSTTKELENTDKILVTQKSLSEDAFFNSAVAGGAGNTPGETGQITMESQEINPNYLALENSASALRIDIARLENEKLNIRAQIDRNSEEFEGLQIELAEKQHQEGILMRNIGLAQQTYDSFYSKYEEIRIAQSRQIGESNTMIVAPAIEPPAPVAPRKTLNVMISAAVGLMFSVFVVFIREYWERTSTVSINRHYQ